MFVKRWMPYTLWWWADHIQASKDHCLIILFERKTRPEEKNETDQECEVHGQITAHEKKRVGTRSSHCLEPFLCGPRKGPSTCIFTTIFFFALIFFPLNRYIETHSQVMGPWRWRPWNISDKLMTFRAWWEWNTQQNWFDFAQFLFYRIRYLYRRAQVMTLKTLFHIGRYRINRYMHFSWQKCMKTKSRMGFTCK